jgi:phosphoserine phosphatase
MKLTNNLLDISFRNRLDNIKYALFDFDGTIYPNLLLVDLARYIFTKHAKMGEEKYVKKLLELSDLLRRSNKITFQEASLGFIDILKGESYSEFVEQSSVFIDRISDRVKFFVIFLRKNNIKCFLVSLTADFIASQVASALSFDKFYSVKYETFKGDAGEILFSGNFTPSVIDPKKFKLGALKYFNLLSLPKEHLLVIGNSVDDIELFKRAGHRIVVNPASELLEQCAFDLVVRNKKDPWHDIFDFFGLNYKFDD